MLNKHLNKITRGATECKSTDQKRKNSKALVWGQEAVRNVRWKSYTQTKWRTLPHGMTCNGDNLWSWLKCCHKIHLRRVNYINKNVRLCIIVVISHSLRKTTLLLNNGKTSIQKCKLFMLLRSSKIIFSFDLVHLGTVFPRNTTNNN